MKSIRRVIALSLAFGIMLLWGPLAIALADDQDGVSVRFVGEIGGPMVAEAYPQSATYHIWDLEKAAMAFWPEADLEAVLSSRMREDDDVLLDGQQLYRETLVYQDASVWMQQIQSHLNYSTNRHAERVRTILEDIYFLLLPDAFDTGIASEAEMHATGKVLLSALGIDCDIVPVASQTIEIRGSGQSYRYNVMDFAFLRDGLLCANSGYASALSAEGPHIPAEQFSVAYNTDGLCEVSMRVFDVARNGEAREVLPHTDVLLQMQKEYAMILGSYEIVLQSAQLCYVAVPVSGSRLRFEYVPAWRFAHNTSAWVTAGTSAGNFYDYNALSGMPIY